MITKEPLSLLCPLLAKNLNIQENKDDISRHQKVQINNNIKIASPTPPKQKQQQNERK